jgi:hypothetical protein
MHDSHDVMWQDSHEPMNDDVDLRATNRAAYRATRQDQARVSDLFKLIPGSGMRALDVGARDGHMSRLLAQRFESVVALDLSSVAIDDPRVAAVRGDVTRLAFADRTFDVVLCAEVLEHVPPHGLRQACAEIARVTRNAVVVGVPYRQDLRSGRTRCQACGRNNPPWGHVNYFDEATLRSLFPTLRWVKASYVGTTTAQTNSVSTALLDFAGNPFGTYDQQEACIHCGAPIGRPRPRTLVQRFATRAAFIVNRVQHNWVRPHGNWIHVLFSQEARST